MMLEKVEIGGIRGNQLSSQVVAIYEEFLELHAKQSAVTYDALDPEGKEFLVDYEYFKVSDWFQWYTWPETTKIR